MDRQLFRSGKTWMAVFAILMFLLAIAGGVHSYSPVPYWDMWDGTLNFYLQITEGNSALWLAQHNEHRILLSRILFWLDYAIFDGLSYFLITINYVLMAFAIFMFWRFSKLQYRTNPDLKPEHASSVLIFSLFILAWLSQWMQWENLAWGFQSQFFLAQSLPLAAFYCLAASASNNHAWPYFCASIILGALSLFTMANGVLALPLLTVAAIFMRAGWLRSGILVASTILGVVLYFGEYHSPDNHASITDTLRYQPLQLLQYVVLYLGSPFFALAGEGRNGLLAAGLSGSILVLLSLLRLMIELRAYRTNPVTLALLGYLLYLGGTAVGTGTGRVVFGVAQAVSFRYTTPALMAWAALLLLYLPTLSMFARRNKKVATAGVVLICALLFWRQLPALQPQHQKIFDRQVAALALELSVADAQQINHVYVMNAGLLSIAEKATALDLTVFGQYPLQDLREKWAGRFAPPSDIPECQGALDSLETIEREPDALRISGWIFNPAEESVPSRVIVSDRLGRIVGFALTGQPRPDVEAAVHDSAGLSGFRGYIKPADPGSVLAFYGEQSQCTMNITLPGGE
ncbi:hypothetical protein [Pseudohongiella nitratireducens]|uniref:hypothetical protein n=1 Tax=Pseudohongiella nitratireducens TaxID=1768907 RepID=UPI0030EDE596|tara:strand:+ start:326 stop:2047 length:1722 start_codon:yes stop_codon:yes gene_type:complete